MTVDIEKAFDFINHSFLLSVLKKIEFDSKFQKWTNILIKNRESSVISGDKTTP